MEPVLYMISFSIILSFLFNRIAFGISFWVRVGFYNVGTKEAERRELYWEEREQVPNI
jgi:hypothetical protein